MTQTGLIGRIFTSLGLDDYTVIPNKTPDEKVLLMKDLDGDPCQGSFGYAIMVGMMLHLNRHMKLGIAMHGHPASRFTICPKRSHDIELKQIGYI